tara:strand:+ start:15493 stop:15762 length:270 start_codon:yes stop_codon:yes gene_type:complete
MITANSLKEFFDSLNKKEIKKAMDSAKDYILFEAHIFNAGGYATIKAKHYSEKKERKATDNGNVFCDKDAFLQLFNESESENKHLKKYV